MSPVPFVDLARQFEELSPELERALLRVARSGHYVLGPEVAALERELAVDHGCAGAVGLNSGTDALLLALRALGIGPGHEVITTPFSFFATSEAIVLAGARPVFADVEPESLNLDPSAVEAVLSERTRAILPVHLYGRPCDMDGILAIARRRDLAVVEDCAQAVGARYRGQPVGSFGALGCLSFFPTKNLGALGDGGMVLGNDTRLLERVRALAAHGSRERYLHQEIGANSRLDEIQAAALRVKRARLAGWTEARRRNAGRYRELLANLPGLALPPPDDERFGSTWHQFTVRAKDRDGLRAHLERRGIASMIYYPVPLHLQPAHRDLGYAPGAFPVAERAAAEVLSLPIHPHLSEEDLRAVAEAVRTWAQSN
ncbi:MAG: DegT/DnrJ/EryC1/StrS family aminotransferase [Myxococcales bacterium]|nr:DegT/DnrJ/EryC1/StrS family aminotransferase [Myxococcales bacterium]